MSNSFENIDFFSKGSPLPVNESPSVKLGSTVTTGKSSGLKSFVDVLRDINAFLEDEEVRQPKG